MVHATSPHTRAAASSPAIPDTLRTAVAEKLGGIGLHQSMVHDAGLHVSAGAKEAISWSLTPAQRREVQHSASADPEISRRYQEALTWFTNQRAAWDKDADSRWHE